MRLTLFPKLLAAFLALSLPPLLWLSLDAARRISDVGGEAVERATRALDAKGRQALELQALGLAEAVSRFLDERVQDLETLAGLPRETGVFLAFCRSRTGEIWGRRRAPSGAVEEVRENAHLYAEAAWIGPEGREAFRVEGGRLVEPAALRDVSHPAGTTYGVEDYFRTALAGPLGEPHVGRVVGYHLGKGEQLAGAATPEEAVDGAPYRGHVRFALAVYGPGGLEGVVALALDHRHLMEFTQHVLPLSRERVAFPTYLSGDYAFLFDDEGWIITHPKFWNIRGIDRSGKWVAPFSTSSSTEDVEAGRIPFNLDHAGFVHPNYPLVASAVRDGRSGVTRTFNVAGVDKVMAYAPIPFARGPYGGRGLFGGVTIGALTEAFHREAAVTGRTIADASRQTLRTGALLAWVLGLAVLGAALWISRAVAGPVKTMARMARRIESGDLSARVRVTRGDEVGDLAEALNRMARLLEEKNARLRASLSDLEASRDDARAYADRLEEQLGTLSHLQSISEILGTTFDREEALRVILRTCAEGLGFDRVILYLVDAEADHLSCVATSGFDPADEEQARRQAFSLGGDDCVPVRVVRHGSPVHVVDIRKAEGLSPLDRVMAEIAGTSSFVYVPMKIRDAVVGALGADNGRTGRPIPAHRVGALQIVAGQAARAVERARLYEEANRARALVEAVIDSLASGLVTLDPAGRILIANPYAGETLALGASGPGRTLEECGVDPALARWVESLPADGGLPESAEFEIATPRGRRTFTWVPSRFHADGEPRLILQFRDITEHLAMNRSLERVDRLASLGRMAAGVAHEIRNPLTGVSLLLDDLHDRLPSEEDRALAAGALREVERLEGIVQELLDYARVGPVTRRACRLAETLEQSLFLVKKQARTQGVSVELEVSPGLPPVWGDPEKLKQALLNLYVNALQAMGGGGSLRVSARAVRGGVVVRVEDTGTGIPPAEVERIFEPFYTLRPGGTGLGLSIAHNIVSDHGGRIEVDTGPGRGTAFTLHLPGA